MKEMHLKAKDGALGFANFEATDMSGFEANDDRDDEEADLAPTMVRKIVKQFEKILDNPEARLTFTKAKPKEEKKPEMAAKKDATIKKGTSFKGNPFQQSLKTAPKFETNTDLLEKLL